MNTSSSMSKTVLCVGLLALAACSGSSSKTYSKDEREPLDKTAAGAVTNDTPETAEPLAAGTPLFGALADDTDVDYYTFHAKASKLLQFDVYAVRLDPTHWSASPTITLYAPDGTTVLWQNGPYITDWSNEDTGFYGVLIPEDGDYYVAVARTGDAVGAYALRLNLSSAPSTLQQEVEAADETGLNNALEDAEPIVPGLMSGSYSTDDDDFYGFTLTETQRVRFTITSHRDGLAGGANDYFDSEIYLIDATSKEYVDNDDSWYLDSAAEAVLPAGDYALHVGQCCSGDPGVVPYLLQFERMPVSTTAETLPNDTRETAMAISYGTSIAGTFAAAGEDHYFRFAGKAGELVRIDGFDVVHMGSPSLLDADGVAVPIGWADGGADYFQTILQADGDYDLRVPSGDAGAFAFMLERIAAARVEVEPNDAAAEESTFGAGGWAAGALSAETDVDRFTFSAAAKELVTLAVLSRAGNGAAMDSAWGSTLGSPVLSVYDGTGALIVETDTLGANNTFPSSIVRPSSTIEAAFRAPASGTYTVAVSYNGGDVLGEHPFYALKLRKGE